MATSKYNVGDKVRIVSKRGKCWNPNGEMDKYFGAVMTISGHHFNKPGLYKMEEDHGRWAWMDDDIVGLVKDEPKDEKIVITHDGKITTATMYGVMGKVIATATARCAPDDKFDFNVGAKLALERLMEKVNPITVGGFKIGDRVNYKGVNGTVICFMKNEYESIGVEFDQPLKGVACHNCKGFTLMAGKVGTKNTSRWMLVKQLTAGEVPEQPKYYSGKVVCVSKGYGTSIPLPDFTVGKIYDVVDGVITDDEGWKYHNYKTLNDICVSMGWTFLGIVK